MDHAIQKPDVKLLDTLVGLAGHYGKSFCFPTQDKLRALHRARTGRHMSRATLNRHLRALASPGMYWLKRTRRHRRGRDGRLELHSTLYTFTRRAVRHLLSLARNIPRALGKAMGQNAGGFRCLSPEPISVPPGQTHGAASLAVGPPDPKKVAVKASEAALTALRQLKATLRGKK